MQTAGTSGWEIYALELKFVKEQRAKAIAFQNKRVGIYNYNSGHYRTTKQTEKARCVFASWNIVLNTVFNYSTIAYFHRVYYTVQASIAFLAILRSFSLKSVF